MRRIIASLVVGLLIAACGGDDGPTRRPDACTPRRLLRTGDPIPACTFERLEGGTLSLPALEGRPIMLNFWASWCPGCIREMPALQRVHDAVGGRVAIVGMNTLGLKGETAAAARTYASARGVDYPMAFDRDGMLYAHFYGSAARPVLPMTVFVDARGKVTKLEFGEQTERDIRATLRTLFGVS